MTELYTISNNIKLKNQVGNVNASVWEYNESKILI